MIGCISLSDNRRRRFQVPRKYVVKGRVRKTVPLVRELERLGLRLDHPSFSSSHRYQRGKFCR